MPPKRNYIQRTTGMKVKGVTTILAVLAKNALIWWGFKQGMRNYEELSKLMAKLLRKPGKDIKVLVEKLLDALTTFEALGLYDKRDEAGNAGSLAHEFIENHFRGIAEPSTKGYPKAAIDKAEGCFIALLDWEKSVKLQVLESEVPVVSEKYPYGGTIDHIIKTTYTENNPQAVEILDIKTGKGIYLEAKVQVASYGQAWVEKYPDRPVGGYHILRLGPNGERTHEFFPSLKDYFPIFIHCLGIKQTLEELGEKL